MILKRYYQTFCERFLSLAIVAVVCASLITALSPPVLSFTSDTRGAEISEPGLPPTCAWLPAGKPTSVLLCIHGLGLHMGSYRDLAEALKKRGMAVYAVDVRGFGSWFLKGEPKLDFEGTIADIGKTIEYIQQRYPTTPIYLLGESMGGAVALQAAAHYQDKIKGLICSVPAGDRHQGLSSDMHVGMHVLTGGFRQRFDAGSLVISYATDNPEHRSMWESDPRSRKMYSPSELLTFQHLMNRNMPAAHSLSSLPVLVIQGTKDRLVLGSGTWDVYDHITSPNRKFAISMAAEHLIYENGQCSPEDLQYTLNWMNNVAAGPATATGSVAVDRPPQTPTTQDSALLASVPTTTPQLIRRNSGISYWIELKRNGQTFRCNNKMDFRSGDEIRFHVSAATDGYAYIFMKQGSSGAHALLFPNNKTGADNSLKADIDCAIPTRTFLKFDNTPGIEKLSLVFAKIPINIDHVIQDPNTVMAFVSPDASGAKDIVPTRMQISWGDTTPLLMPTSASSTNIALASTSSLVQVACNNPHDVMSLEIALEHK